MTTLRAPYPCSATATAARSGLPTVTDQRGAVDPQRRAETNAAISPDNANVLFRSGSNARFETYYNGRLFVAPASGGPARVVVGEQEPIDVDRAIWSKDGKSIYFLANLGVHEEIFVVPASGGTPRQITNGKHSLSGWSLTADRFAFIAANSHSGGEVWTMAPGDTAPKQITHVSTTRDATSRSAGRRRSLESADGVTIEGLVTYPVAMRRVGSIRSR
jgi:Tol biopolymer transport system component